MPMQNKNIRPQQTYGLTNAIYAAAQPPIIVGRDPTVNDNAFLGTMWINPVDGDAFILTQIIGNQSTWIQVVNVTGNNLVLTGYLVVNGVNPATGAGIEATGGEIQVTNHDFIALNDLANNSDDLLTFIKQRGAGPLAVGDNLGAIRFQGFDGVNYTNAAGILSAATGAVIAPGQVAGDLEFWTHPDSFAPLSQRMVIDQLGTVTINTADNGISLVVEGIVSEPHQACFKAFMPAPPIINATGAGIAAQVPLTVLASYDLSNNFNNITSSFLAPIAGVYHFEGQVLVSNLAAGNTDGYLTIRWTSGNFDGPHINPFTAIVAGGNSAYITISTDIQLNNLDVVTLWVTVEGGTQIVTIENVGTDFCGRLCC